MIFNPADLNGWASEALERPTQVGVKIGLDLFGKEANAVFCAEDEVHKDV